MNQRTLCCALVTAALSGPGAAHAGGLFVPDIGSQAMGRAGAFTAKADDPAALHHNPAGFARIAGTVVHMGMNLIDYSLTFTRAGVYEATDGEDLPYAGDPYPTVENDASPGVGIAGMQAIPLIAVASDLGGAVRGLRVGLGVMAPHAYPNRSFGDYEFEDPGVPPPPQRYDIVEQEAVTVLPSMAAAYSIMDKLDVGARLSWGLATIKAASHTWAILNYEEWVASDGLFQFEVSDNFVPAFGLGVLYRPISSVELGLSYASALHIRASGTGTATLGIHAADLDGNGQDLDTIIPLMGTPACAAGGEPGALKTCVNLSLPQTATLGGRYIILRDAAGRERADVELDIKWEDWSTASDYEIIVDGQSEQSFLPLNTTIIRHGLQDVWSVRLGGSYSLPLGESELALRGGIAHDTATAPESWQRVDLDGAARTTLALGAAWRASRYRVDVAGGWILEGDRTALACNPDTGTEGCPPGSGQLPVREREAPDPAQPLLQPDQQFQSPFNGGEYSSGYLIFSLGVTAWF